jgi:hypothetical protein
MLYFLKRFTFGTLTFILVAYGNTEIFDFEIEQPFAGDTFFNPYQKVSGEYLKANFHAHSKSWGGLTNGSSAAERVIKAYNDSGYDIAGLSNYHSVSHDFIPDRNIYIPIYEHGINLQKSHYLVINAQKVLFNDVLLFHTVHSRQSVLNRLKNLSDLVSINHPEIRNGHSTTELQQLGNYSHIELINGASVARAHWDSALSAGKPVWALSNDDVHRISERKFGKSWTAVYTDSEDLNGVLNAMRRGRSLAIHNKKRESLTKEELFMKPPVPDSISMHGNRLSIVFNSDIESIRLYGQSGKLKKEVTWARRIDYHFEVNDTYIRAEISDGHFDVFVNPVLRVENNLKIPSNGSSASISHFKTFCFRLFLVITWVLAGVVLFPNTTRRLTPTLQ